MAISYTLLLSLLKYQSFFLIRESGNFREYFYGHINTRISLPVILALMTETVSFFEHFYHFDTVKCQVRTRVIRMVMETSSLVRM